jgi:PAS domain S-box-containing protein
MSKTEEFPMMTQRRKIAIAFLLAVPVVLAIVLFQNGTLLRVGRTVDEIAQAAQIRNQSENALYLLTVAESDAWKYVVTGNAGYRTSHQENLLHLDSTLQALDELARTSPSARQQSQSIALAIRKQMDALEQAVGSNREGRVAGNHLILAPAWGAMEQEIARIRSGMGNAPEQRLNKQKVEADRNVWILNTLITYGGALIVWLIAVAAFLLFHDDKESVIEGVERQVQAKILEGLPIGICLTTESGLILYTNPAEEEVFGYEHGELLGRNFSTMHSHSEDGSHGSLNDIIGRLGDMGSWSGQLPIFRKDGTRSTTESSIMTIHVPGKELLVFLHNLNGKGTLISPETVPELVAAVGREKA